MRIGSPRRAPEDPGTPARPGGHEGACPHRRWRGGPWGPPGPWRHAGGSLRRRLAWAFFVVAALSAAGTFAAMAPPWFGHHGPRGWNFHLFLVALAIAAAASVFFARRITSGLTRLRDAVERFDLRDPAPRVPVEGDDEVAALARAFNRMADRLEADERARRQLFADVAHELRHPVAVLRGRLEAMQDGAVPTDGEQVLRLQDTVIGLGRLVGDLRDLSLADVGRLSLDLGPVDLGALIADLCENFEPVAAHRRIALRTDVGPGLPPVTADADRLRQVLVNLLSNALQYTPEGGAVTIRVAVEAASAGDRVAGGAARGAVTIEVADTGPGIAAEHLAHVFDRFYRTDPARGRATGGSGLGLAIVRSLVALHGGTVAVRSRPGEGSRFTVRLPLEPARRGPRA